jgi:hypothetical protein
MHTASLPPITGIVGGFDKRRGQAAFHDQMPTGFRPAPVCRAEHLQTGNVGAGYLLGIEKQRFVEFPELRQQILQLTGTLDVQITLNRQNLCMTRLIFLVVHQWTSLPVHGPRFYSSLLRPQKSGTIFPTIRRAQGDGAKSGNDMFYQSRRI